jgi:hypothetical protein
LSFILTAPTFGASSVNSATPAADRHSPDALLREAEAQRALAELFPHLQIDALRAIQELFPLKAGRPTQHQSMH